MNAAQEIAEALALASVWLKAIELGQAAPGDRLAHARKVVAEAERLARVHAMLMARGMEVSRG